MDSIAERIGAGPEAVEPGDVNLMDIDPEAEGEAGGVGLRRLFTAETGPGEIDDYLSHPMNFDGSNGIAQVLRGATGLFGSLRLAVLDILLGVVRWTRERTASANNAGVGRP